jgi:fucokinase
VFTKVHMECAAPSGGPGLAAVSAHLCLVFTGQPRLAKHLLVEVLRRWWAAAPNADEEADASDTTAGAAEEEETEDKEEEEEEGCTNDGANGGAGVRATVRALVRDAPRAAAALQAGDLPTLGQLLRRYHAQKRRLAGPTYEPAPLAALVRALRPLAHGVCFCGAGGGGFLAVLAKGPCAPGSSSWAAVSAVAAAHGGSVHAAALVDGGLEVQHVVH